MSNEVFTSVVHLLMLSLLVGVFGIALTVPNLMIYFGACILGSAILDALDSRRNNE